MRWWQRLIRRQQLETQADKELQFHLAGREAELIARGGDPREAHRQARVELGGVEQVKEQLRDARGTRWLDDLSQDVRYALRGLRRKPGFAAVVICTLALGGGATTIIFTVANGVLLRPLPYPQPNQLVSIQEKTDWSTAYGNVWAFAYPTFVAEPLRPFVGDAGSTLWLLLGAVSLVLVIACANIASLLLARAVSRDREMAMRAALGARRGRLIRQCLTESAVLGLLGGALGILVTTVGVGRFVEFWPGTLPRAEEVQIDWRVLVFAVGLSLMSGILFGLAPALRAPARDLERTLRAGSWTVARSSRRLHRSFVMSQVAIAVVLLVCAGMLGRALLRLSWLDPGVEIRNVLVTRMAISPSVLASPTAIRAAWDDVLDRARRVPGVKAVAMVDTVPMREGNNQLEYWTSAAMPSRDQRPTALATSVTPDYLEVMGLPLRRGRFFDDRDRLNSEPVIVIDDVLSRQTFGDEDPVGKRLWFQDLGGPVLIVGVVGHVRHWGLASDDQAQVRAQMYYPIAQVPDRLMRRWSELMSIAVRTSGSPMNFLDTLRLELRGTAGDQVLYQTRTLEQLANDTLARQRFLLLLFGMFAGVALLLACIGVYGVQAYLTSQRVPEFGVRMALGASAADVIRLVLGESLKMIFAGIAVGTLGAIAAGRVLSGLVDGVQPTEVSTVALVISLLVVAALVAGFVPARRASLVDTVAALRRE